MNSEKNFSGNPVIPIDQKGMCKKERTEWTKIVESAIYLKSE